MNAATSCTEICIELTTKCLQRCVHCSSNSTIEGESPRQLQLDEVFDILSWFAAQGGRLVEFSGGDPLLYGGIQQCVSRATELGLESRIYTTGIAGDQAESAALLRDLATAGARGFVFSLQGATIDTHEQITRLPGSFRRTLRAIEDCVAMGLWTGVHFVPMKPNAHELVAAVELVERLGVDEFAALRFVPQGRGCENRDALELSYEAFQALLSELANLVVESNRLVVRAGCPMSFCSVYRSEIVPQECEAGRSSVLIDPNGDMYPCPALKQVPELSISTRSGAGIAAGWEGDAWDTVRGVTPESLTGDCSSCIRVAECVGRCAAQRYLSHGSFLVGPDPMCPLSRETTTEASAAQTT